MCRPRVLLVVRPVQGGIRTHIRHLLEYLGGDFAFTVVCAPEQANDFAVWGAKVFPVPISGGMNPLADARVVLSLNKYLRRHGVALIHAHGYKAGMVARIAGRLARKPCLITVHGDFVHAAGSSFFPLYRRTEKFFGKWATGYIAVSRSLAKQMHTDFGVPYRRIAVISNGISTEPVIPAGCDRPADPGELLVGTVARLAPQKGVAHFLRAAALLAGKHPQACFVVAGDGPQRKELESLVKTLGLADRVLFLGHVDFVRSLLRRLRVFVLPSVSEGQGLTILEAMAAGCPIVASAAGGITEVIRHGENGLLAEPGNSGDLAVCIDRLIGDAAWASELAGQAQADAQAYDIRLTAGKTRQLYRNILEGGWSD